MLKVATTIGRTADTTAIAPDRHPCAPCQVQEGATHEPSGPGRWAGRMRTALLHERQVRPLSGAVSPGTVPTWIGMETALAASGSGLLRLITEMFELRFHFSSSLRVTAVLRACSGSAK